MCDATLPVPPELTNKAAGHLVSLGPDAVFGNQKQHSLRVQLYVGPGGVSEKCMGFSQLKYVENHVFHLSRGQPIE